jgi:hypothetical protein
MSISAAIQIRHAVVAPSYFYENLGDPARSAIRPGRSLVAS